jgi:nicotinamidase-related amidase
MQELPMLTLERNRTAVLIMDFQQEILTRLGEQAAPLLENATAVIAAARGADVPILYVVVGFRAGYPEISERNLSFASVKQGGLFTSATPAANIHPAVQPRPSDVVVVKHRVGAFAGTDLEMILRAKGRDTLVLAGFSTSGVILSTLRHAADADYRIVLLKDVCADVDPEVHRVLVDKVFPRQASVVTAGEVITALTHTA